MRNPSWKALPETRLKRNWRLPVFCGSLRTGSKPSPMPSSLQQFKCPGCGTPFSAADVDNRRDTVTCSSCGLSTPWTSLVREHEFHDVPAAPSRHLAVTSAHGKVTLTYRHSFTKILLYTGLAVVWGTSPGARPPVLRPGKTDSLLPRLHHLLCRHGSLHHLPLR